MLTEYDIDVLHNTIKNKGFAEIYYLAHNTETREGLMDEASFKSVPRFKILKVKLTGIQNAYFEYLNYKNNPSNYHIEEEVEYYDMSGEYYHYFTVPNNASGNKDINPRMPSIIYGYLTKIKERDSGTLQTIECKSCVKPVYYNDLKYGDYSQKDITTFLSNHDLDFKYKKLTAPEYVDGIRYEYVSSNWYILDIDNFIRSEKGLINTHEKTMYFRDINEAFYCLDQLQA